MWANTFPNLQKCGEILIDIKSKNKRNAYIFHCTFCNMECDQLKKFSCHIGEEHLNNIEDDLRGIELKVETESEEIQTFNGDVRPDIKVFESSMDNKTVVNLEPLHTVRTVETISEYDVLNVQVKEELIENSIDGSVDWAAFMDDCEKESKKLLEDSESNYDTNSPFDTDSNDEIENDVDQISHKRKLNFSKKRKRSKQKGITNEMSFNESKDIDANPLRRALRGNPIYTELRSYYDKYGHLGTAEQNKLTRTIVDFYVSRKIRLNSSNLQMVASQIVKLFPSESEEVYFEKQRNRRAKGKLHFRYQNMLKSKVKPHRKSPLFTAKRKSLFENERISFKIKHFLKYNFTDKEQTCQSWKQCIEYRLKELTQCEYGSIANAVDNWPAYKQSFGAELVSLDFEGLYPGKSKKFFLNWTKLNMILPTYYNMNLKDIKLKSIWFDAKEKWTALDQNSKDALFIFIIHGIIKPERTSKVCGRATIAESQLATIKFIEKDIELNLYTGQSPFILIRKSVFSVEDIFVVADQVIYKIDTVAAALAVCFKIHKVFNLKYNGKCANFWLFVQRILFEIHLESDYVGNSLRNISSFFESQK